MKNEWHSAWAEYQQLRYKYKTDDVSKWSEDDMTRAAELQRITSNISEDDIHAFIAEKREQSGVGIRGKLRKLLHLCRRGR